MPPPNDKAIVMPLIDRLDDGSLGDSGFVRGQGGDRKFRQAVERDLNRLVQSRRVPLKSLLGGNAEKVPAPSSDPEKSTPLTILHYGIPDITQVSLKERDGEARLRFEEQVRRCIQTFQPWVRTLRLHVYEDANGRGTARMDIVVSIDRMLPEDTIELRASLDAKTGEWRTDTGNTAS